MNNKCQIFKNQFQYMYLQQNGEVIQQAYVIDSVIPQAVVNTEITNDMVKTFNLARTVKFLATG